MATNFIAPSWFAIRREGEGSGGGMKKKHVSLAVFSRLELNTETIITDTAPGMALSFSIEEPAEDKVSEYVLIFKAEENTSFAIAVPEGYALNWPDGEPEWTAGKVYELNFHSLDIEIGTNKVISVLWKEHEEAEE